MGNSATLDKARTAIAGVIRSITMHPAGQVIFSTEPTRDMLVNMGNATTWHQVIDSIAVVISKIALNPAGQAIFNNEATRHMLVAMRSNVTISNATKVSIDEAILNLAAVIITTQSPVAIPVLVPVLC
jgi:hypothetical protein